MPPAKVSNPNDFKVVTFTNREDFDFTPEMGCMYDSRPIFGISGGTCIKAGESIVLPFHVGDRLATNLAKAAMIRRAPATDPVNVPTGVPLWSETQVETLKMSYLKDMYTEQSPIMQSETDRLMAKVEEYKKMVDVLLAKDSPSAPVVPAPAAPIASSAPDVPPVADTNNTSVSTQTPEGANVPPTAPSQYQDKGDVVAELKKRGIQFDARKSKADLEKLLV